MPLLPETIEICEALELDPLGLLASGALLAVVAPADVVTAMKALRADGIEAAAIGRLTPEDQGVRMHLHDAWHDVPAFPRDELARFFEEGLEEGA